MDLKQMIPRDCEKRQPNYISFTAHGIWSQWTFRGGSVTGEMACSKSITVQEKMTIGATFKRSLL